MRRKAPLRFLALPCEAGLRDEVLVQRMEETKSAGTARWVALDALPAKGHTARQRIAHLVNRMLTAKMHGAEAIFISRPLEPERGLVDRDGGPSELFLPWRTTALMLGGAAYVGDIELPQGTPVHCFCGQGRFVAVLPGGRPRTETAYLGQDLRVHDLWGNSRPCPPTIVREEGPTALISPPQSAIPVDELPTFLTGLDGSIIAWQVAAVFAPIA